MIDELRSRGFATSKERVERLIGRTTSGYATSGDSKRRRTRTKHKPAPGLLDRNFAPAAPNQVWTSDLTCIWTDEGWFYLPIVLDVFSREVIGPVDQAPDDSG